MPKLEIDRSVDLWLEGNEAAFKHILDYYYRVLLSATAKSISNRKEAEEVVMNTMLKFWQSKSRLQEVLNIEHYLFGILRQETARLYRKQILFAENIDDLSADELGITEHPELSLKDLQARYQAALGKLTPRQREVFLSIREFDMSHKEVAEKTGMSVLTVNSHMNAALRILRKELQEHPDALIAIFLVPLVTQSSF